MEVGDEMEIFIKLTNYNAHQEREKALTARSDYLVSFFPYLSSSLPNGQVWHKPFLGGSSRRALTKTWSAAPKMPSTKKKGAPQEPGDKPQPLLAGIEPRGTLPLRLEEGRPRIVSAGLLWLPGQAASIEWNIKGN